METTLPTKRQGEAAEAAFLERAINLGLTVAKPWGENVPFDFIVVGETGLHKVQVKSVRGLHPKHASYQVALGRRHPGKPRYTAKEIDFLAALVIPERTWYIIPVRALGRRRTLCLGSHDPQSRCLFQPYREAWSLLT